MEEDLRKSRAIPYEKACEDIAGTGPMRKKKPFARLKAVDEIVRSRLAVDKLEI